MMDFTGISQGKKVFEEITLGRDDIKREEFKVHQYSPQQNKLRQWFCTTGCWKSSQMPGGGEGNKTLLLVACCTPFPAV